MSRKTRIAAMLAVAASAIGGTASPAAASTAASELELVCYEQINVPDCVDWAFDVAQRTIEYAEENAVPIVQNGANTAVCLALEVITGRDCPYWPPPRS